MKKRRILLAIYFVLLFVPLYWMLVTSLKTDQEILAKFTLIPDEVTYENYAEIFTSEVWRNSFMNSLIYVLLNVAITVTVAVPAAYAFSRWSFRGSHHLFFWLLTNRMAPAAIFTVPFFELFSTLGLFDTHLAVALAHCLFNIPLAIWILEGFMSGIPKEIDETAYIDGYSFPRFFAKIFLPLIGPGIGVAAFFCFTFSDRIIRKLKTYPHKTYPPQKESSRTLTHDDPILLSISAPHPTDLSCKSPAEYTTGQSRILPSGNNTRNKSTK